jgi:hypothetical protein
VSYVCAIPQGIMAPHLHIPVPNVPGAPNYGFMPINAFPAGAGPASSGFGAQSGFHVLSSLIFPGRKLNYSLGHQVPYNSSVFGAQQHALSPPDSASNWDIPPTVQMQAA